jgi:YVTN family beta-propeller protein
VVSRLGFCPTLAEKAAHEKARPRFDARLPAGSCVTHAQNAYITNLGSNTVSVIATATNKVVGLPIPVGLSPFGVAVTPDGSKV